MRATTAVAGVVGAGLIAVLLFAVLRGSSGDDGTGEPPARLTDSSEGETATPPASTTRPPVIVTPTETAAATAATAIATPEPTAATEPAEDPCAPQPVAWVSIDDIDPDTWVPPPLPVVCFPEDWELATWRPDAPLVPGTPHRPWVLVDGRPIDGPPDARRLEDLRKLLFSYDQMKQVSVDATAAPGLDASYVRPWITGRRLAVIDSVFPQLRARWEERPFSSRELTHHDEVVAVDLRGLDAYVYSFRRGYRDYYRYEDTGELFAPGWVVNVGGWAQRWERDPDLKSGRWLSEYSRATPWANDDGLQRVRADLPAFEALLPYHHFYMAVAEAEYRVSEWPRHPLLRD